MPSREGAFEGPEGDNRRPVLPLMLVLLLVLQASGAMPIQEAALAGARPGQVLERCRALPACLCNDGWGATFDRCQSHGKVKSGVELASIVWSSVRRWRMPPQK